MRSPRSWSRLLIVGVAVAGGCVGQVSGGGGGDRPDASGTPGVDARPGDARPADGPAAFVCRDKITTGLDNGHHNPGQDCQSSCHNHNFFLSGTIYTTASGGTPVVGASITFIDANGFTGDMHSGLNGNFWWAAFPVTFPVKIIVSSCPDIKPMTATVNASGAGCNQSGCHGSSASPGRVHLP